jgi:hypothetical protein
MSKDARFEDADEAPLRLAAMDAEDLAVISAMAQDAVFPATEMTWDRAHRRFALLVNRFRWEDKAAAEAQGRPYERVRSVLAIEDVTHVASEGIDRADGDTILSLLALDWREGGEGTGAVILTLAGDGAIRVNVECLNVTLSDVTRPYAAPSGKAPHHHA